MTSIDSRTTVRLRLRLLISFIVVHESKPFNRFRGEPEQCFRMAAPNLSDRPLGGSSNDNLTRPLRLTVRPAAAADAIRTASCRRIATFLVCGMLWVST